MNDFNIPKEMRNFYIDFLDRGCIINGKQYDLNEIYQMEWKDFAEWVYSFRPKKLYKFFSNQESKNGLNYSIKALEHNAVYLSSPSDFDDVYDSDIAIDYSIYERVSLIEYCRRCGIMINQELDTNKIVNIFLNTIFLSSKKHNDYEHIFTVKHQKESERLENIIFCNRLNQNMQNTDDLRKAVSLILQNEYLDYIKQLKETFRVSCFTTNPFSQLMWSMYADCHKGFCVEYTLLSDDSKYTEIFLNIFPLIYSKKRSDVSALFSKIKINDFSDKDINSIYYHGVLRKNLEWAFQNEWRLVKPLKYKSDYNMPFFPITKVFLGNRMEANERKNIINICNKRNIPYVGVIKNPKIFEMQECENKCENCQQYTLKL